MKKYFVALTFFTFAIADAMDLEFKEQVAYLYPKMIADISAPFYRDIRGFIKDEDDESAKAKEQALRACLSEHLKGHAEDSARMMMEGLDVHQMSQEEQQKGIKELAEIMKDEKFLDFSLMALWKAQRTMRQRYYAAHQDVNGSDSDTDDLTPSEQEFIDEQVRKAEAAKEIVVFCPKKLAGCLEQSDAAGYSSV